MSLSRFLVLVGLALPLGGACGSVLGTNDGGGGTAGSTSGRGGAGGGKGGNGGAGGTGGVSCSDLATQYTDALPAAQSCDLNAGGECQQLVSSSLSPCFVNCLTYVNDPSALNAIKASWVQAGCDSLVGTACPAIACLQPTNNMCLVRDGGSGTCSNSGAGAGGSIGTGGAGGGGAGGKGAGTGGHAGTSGGKGGAGGGAAGSSGSGGAAGTGGTMGGCGICPNPTDSCTPCGTCCPRGALCICPKLDGGGSECSPACDTATLCCSEPSRTVTDGGVVVGSHWVCVAPTSAGACPLQP